MQIDRRLLTERSKLRLICNTLTQDQILEEAQHTQVRTIEQLRAVINDLDSAIETLEQARGER